MFNEQKISEGTIKKALKAFDKTKRKRLIIARAYSRKLNIEKKYRVMAGLFRSLSNMKHLPRMYSVNILFTSAVKFMKIDTTRYANGQDECRRLRYFQSNLKVHSLL